ncbi:hypothetical protein B0T22DRAFT_436509 [Podospora appendiculata]|uniref:Uncharacterized protein n=1 Tax=Podospora appendiculata TaxID=314037 RepID=A0AAE1CG39_9PEZI|nr:hypothetical protein B0T22DRAFT_436509 [Podospora appendiculata]
MSFETLSNRDFSHPSRGSILGDIDKSLSLSADERPCFVQQNLSDKTQAGSLHVQNLTGRDELSEPKMSLLTRETLQAVERATAPSIDATALITRLGQIPSESEHRTMQAWSYCPSPSCSPTIPEVPWEDHARDYEIRCHQALLDDACRPLFHLDLLLQIRANSEAYGDLLRPWSRRQTPQYTEEWQALSRQWDQWKDFREWQLYRRRRRPRFEEYLDTYRRDHFLVVGRLLKDADRSEFEEVAHMSWERKFNYKDEDAKGAVMRQAEFVARWLTYQEFVPRRPFQLLADPKEQDQWTTYVEYLAFEVADLSILDKAARRLQKKAKTHDHERKYQAAKVAADLQQSRVDWIISEIHKIESEQAAAKDESGDSKSDSMGVGCRKRKRTVDTDEPEDAVEPQLGKRGREETVIRTEKLPVDNSDNLSHKRQGKRGRPSVDEEVEEENASEPRPKRSKAAGKSDDPSTIPQPLASGPEAPAVPAVSAMTTAHPSPPPPRRRSKRLKPPRGSAAEPPVPRDERLKSLRPRVNGKVATVSTDSRPPAAARRSRGRPRAAAWSIS